LINPGIGVIGATAIATALPANRSGIFVTGNWAAEKDSHSNVNGVR
jgi:hypothetical protein